MVQKLICSTIAFACLFSLSCAFPGPNVDHACYQQGLLRDQNFDLSFVCNDMAAYPYPTEEIEQALFYADDHWAMYLNLTSTCFNEKDDFYMNGYTDVGYYRVSSVCNTTRIMVHTVYAPDSQVCYVVRPMAQKIYHSICGGACNLGYDHVTGYECIQKGITTRNFLAYCKYPNTNIISNDSPLYAYDPMIDNFYDPRLPHETERMRSVLVGTGRFQRLGYFTELSVTLPTYCGCRGYFCY